MRSVYHSGPAGRPLPGPRCHVVQVPRRGPRPGDLMPTELKLTGAWKKLSPTLDPKKFDEAISKNVGMATQFNGQLMSAEIRKRIRQKKYAANSSMTVLIKKSSTPLIDDGDLWGAITSKNIDEFTVFVG